MHRTASNSATRVLVDEYGNRHYLAEELARGGQGVVFRTKDGDLAIKQPLGVPDAADATALPRERFRNIRLLPLPRRILISLPLALLRDEPGYVMRLLNGMKPLETLEMNGTMQRQLENAINTGELRLPNWLANIPDKKTQLRLFYYGRTGSTRRRLFVLSQCASILARLHFAGIVYGDISPKNVFIGEGDAPEVWLIDSDNLRLEMTEGGSGIFTPQYGAPEIVQGRDGGRPRTDCWAFAVLAFQVLTLWHPFIGKKVLESEEESGWDADPPATGEIPADPYEQAYAGYLPFIDDEKDTSNAAIDGCGIPRELVTTLELRRLFQETFSAGRTQPHRRPVMAFWAMELARAFDRSLTCPSCSMSYFADEWVKCPYCDTARPAFAWVTTPQWKMCAPAGPTEICLPHRLVYPFSFEQNNKTEHEVTVDWNRKTIAPLPGTKRFPPDLSFEFVEAAQ
ncbi:MAG: hypothetical protein KatS3mg110_0950 [Pirellulaceae bacterium]|nr:MAG: hypothetical protein KatS3mg110_0950 [Pirellulaceae bacterium]